jgi:2-keto-4-pentenoate hydratase/2-oxohepta-3-ene-1,7-dioic acid hydratase in catechol pathway
MRYALLRDGEAGTLAAVLEDGQMVAVPGVFAAAVNASGPEVVGLSRDFVLPASPLEAAMTPDFGKALTQAASTARVNASAFPPPGHPLLPPLPRPNRILAIGRNYADHARELGNAVPEDPIVFLKASTSVIGPGEAIEIPDWVGRVDYEAELLVVLGKGGKNIAEADAMRHVVGYSVFNDVTARERQRAAQEKRHPWFLAKSLDTFGPLGPYLVTADAVPDPHNLRITLTVNGETRQDGSTASMIYPIPALIAYLSRWFALEPGDVIATGTPAGVGPLAPGDVVSITVEGVGTLTNPVVSASPA